MSEYDSKFPNKRISESYLEILVESWLRDLAYNWKTDNPPKLQELKQIDKEAVTLISGKVAAK